MYIGVEAVTRLRVFTFAPFYASTLLHSRSLRCTPYDFVAHSPFYTLAGCAELERRCEGLSGSLTGGIVCRLRERRAQGLVGQISWRRTQFMENTSNAYLSPTVGGDNEVEDSWKVEM